ATTIAAPHWLQYRQPRKQRLAPLVDTSGLTPTADLQLPVYPLPHFRLHNRRVLPRIDRSLVSNRSDLKHITQRRPQRSFAHWLHHGIRGHSRIDKEHRPPAPWKANWLGLLNRGEHKIPCLHNRD